MKYLFIVLITLAVGCSSDDSGQKTYTDLTGDWKFSSGVISGEFTIGKATDGSFFLESGGSFKIKNKSYTNEADQTKLQLSVSYISYGILLEDYNSDNSVREGSIEIFGEHNSDFTKIEGDAQYSINCESTCEEFEDIEEVIVTR